MEVPALILGAGAAGLMCASRAGPGALVIDHAKAPGEKIRISGGGRCNFTNMGVEPDRFLSANPHFAKSALARYTQWDFLGLVQAHGIAWHEKTLGQLFCDGKATQVVQMLRDEIARAGADLWLRTAIADIAHDGTRFRVALDREGRRVVVTTPSLVLATGGLSIPKMGATGAAYRIARQFGHHLVETRPALVPLTFTGTALEPLAALSGVSAPARATAGGTGFDESVLFTHRGLSGPAILQISSYWQEGAPVQLDLDPGGHLLAALKEIRAREGRRAPARALAQHLPQRLVAARLAGDLPPRLADCSDATLDRAVAAFRDWRLTPSGTEGYRTAEVTAGGIDTAGLSSKTMESRHLPGLYAIGEAVDVTGWLGGYNFQWAWSSGWAAGEAIRARA